MKRLKNIIILLMLALSFSGELLARNGNGNGNRNGSGQRGGQINDLPATELTEKQFESLVFMLEEEKLARDVYITLYKKYNHRTFNNISKSEQKHMNAIKNLLDRRELEYSIPEDTVGQFADSHLQELYDALIVRGSKSLKDALTVGFDIEVLDIKDLEELVVGMPEDVTFVFGRLLRASFKHKAAFEKNLDRQ